MSHNPFYQILLLTLVYNYLNKMFDSLLLENPYANIYTQNNFNSNWENFTKEDAAKLIKHIGLMYNTFGQAIKDFVKVLSCKFESTVIEPVANESKVIASQQSKQSSRRSDTNEQKATQKPPRKKSAANKQKQKPNGNKSKKNLGIIKQYPRAANHQSFDLDFMSQQIKDAKKQINKEAQKQQNQHFSNFNNLSRFHSQFANFKSFQDKSNSNNMQNNDSKGSLLNQNWKPKVNNQLSIPNQKSSNSRKSPVTTSDNKSQNSEDDDISFEADLNDKEQTGQNSFVRIRGGRKKKDREQLQGVSCIQCEKYYNAMNIEGTYYCDCTSRHRTNLPTRKLKQQFTQQFDL